MQYLRLYKNKNILCQLVYYCIITQKQLKKAESLILLSRNIICNYSDIFWITESSNIPWCIVEDTFQLLWFLSKVNMISFSRILQSMNLILEDGLHCRLLVLIGIFLLQLLPIHRWFEVQNANFNIVHAFLILSTVVECSFVHFDDIKFIDI